LNKTDYILRAIAKISKKRWEHYAITRIFHRLDDLDVEFVCQQCIRKDDQKIYLADLYYPRLGLYLEIDEGHHDRDEDKIKDAERRFDITEASGLREYRISASGVTLHALNDSIDDFVEIVTRRKIELVQNQDFTGWDYENRYTALPHLEKGFLQIGPHSLFRTHKDALNCFGYDKGHYQRGVWNLPEEVRDAVGLNGSCMVWFPKLYSQDRWENSLSTDGQIITETNTHYEGGYEEKWGSRIVMAHSRDKLNRTLYRFVGVFEIIPEYRVGKERQFRRIATRVSTFQPSKCTNPDVV
jgi:very-short-patch-repair endonuclease